MTERKSKDGKFAHEGGNASFHHVDSGNLFGTAEGDRKEGSTAPDLRVTKRIGGEALKNDEAERWLRENDSMYSDRDWNG